jgi:phage FluMu protein gp41
MRKLKLTLIAFALGLGACGTSAETERKLAELEQVNSQKDSLMQEVAISSRLISDINVELGKAKVRNDRLRVSSESPMTASSDTLMARLRYVVARVGEVEGALAASRQRVKNLTTLSDSLRTAFDSTVSNLQAVIATQKNTIDFLTDRVNTLTTENVALRDSLSTGYYVIGTRDALKKKGILTEQGGGRVLFVLWRSGKTLQPARNLNPTLFTSIDTRKVTQIPLPVASASYKVASLQDLDYIEEQRDNGKYSGVSTLTITSPADFWQSSKFLIIILEGSSRSVATSPPVSSESREMTR